MILIAIGGNLLGADGAPPLETCRQAVAALELLPGLRLCGLSAWYVTAPVPASDQPSYVNAVARLQVVAGAAPPDPGELLRALQALEAAAGRARGAPNAARTLDLDIIAMGPDGQMVRTAPDPVLPHPRAHERAFVLVPLCDVAPEWVHPVLRQGADELLAALPPQDVRRM